MRSSRHGLQRGPRRDVATEVSDATTRRSRWMSDRLLGVGAEPVVVACPSEHLLRAGDERLAKSILGRDIVSLNVVRTGWAGRCTSPSAGLVEGATPCRFF